MNSDNGHEYSTIKVSRRDENVPDGPGGSASTSTYEFTQLNPFSSTGRQRDASRNSTDTYQYLEMEQPSAQPLRVPLNDNDDMLMGISGGSMEQTTSGLRLTHRQTTTNSRTDTRSNVTHNTATSTSTIWGDPEEEMRYVYGQNTLEARNFSNTAIGEQHMLRCSKMMLYILAAVTVLGTASIWHSSHFETTQHSPQLSTPLARTEEQPANTRQQILLRPLPLKNQTHDSTHSQSRKLSQAHNVAKPDKHHGLIQDLRAEFDDWIHRHDRQYHSEQEKEKRYKIWETNHHATIAKNERHGPCKMTQKHVFGDNLFKDLSPEEFKTQYLTGYKGPKTDQEHNKKPVLNATAPVQRHEKVQEKYNQRHVRKLGYSASSSSCEWYDVSCWLRLFVNKYGYTIGGTMEPGYDPNYYASAIDWRDYGVVSDVHSQGNCGACWAITAVETIESSYAIFSGTMLDLAESEVIVCDDTCDLCEGGWPQNAFEYTMEHKGLPLANTWSYDGDTLLGLTYSKNGEDGYDAGLYESYVNQYCPSGNSNGQQRYANIKGYGYATDKCVCYTDGTGCSCDEQNEKLAISNVATYGPAVVCLEASMWQDYSGGIITTDLGCSSAFLDMNHCVQTVGYAYVDSSDEEEDEGSGSNSGSNSRDSKDEAQREGYWIIRNQWSSSWGMNGYAYVAMGDNTCGVLNDMTIVYMD